MFKSNLSFFKTSDNLKKPPLETDPQETQPLATRIFKGFMEKVTEKAASISQKTQEATNTVSNWKNFLIFFIIGCVLLMLAFTFLPILALAPQKFSSLFTLGSLCILFSLGVLKGFNNLAKSLCNKEKWTYTAAYIFSVGGTLYFALIQKSYIFVLIASGIQIFCLLLLLSTNFPGGVQSVKFLGKKFITCTLGCFGKLFSSEKKSSFLPI